MYVWLRHVSGDKMDHSRPAAARFKALILLVRLGLRIASDERACAQCYKVRAPCASVYRSALFALAVQNIERQILFSLL